MGKILLIHLASPGLGDKAFGAHKSINKKEVLFLNVWKEAWAYKKGDKVNLAEQITELVKNDPIDKIILSAHGTATDISSFFSEQISENGMPLAMDLLFNVKECMAFVRDLLKEGNLIFPPEFELNVCFGARTINFNRNHLTEPINPMQSLAYATFLETIRLNPNKPFELSAYIGVVQTEILRKKQFAISTEEYYQFQKIEYEQFKNYNQMFIDKTLTYFGEEKPANVQAIFCEKILNNDDKLFKAYCWCEEEIYTITDISHFSDPDFILDYTKKISKNFNIEDNDLAELIVRYIASTQWNNNLQRIMTDRDDEFFKDNYGKMHFAYDGKTCVITMHSENEVATFHKGPLLIQENDIDAFEKKSFEKLINSQKCKLM